MNTKEWLDKVAPNATVNALATRSGIYTSTLDKQIKRGHLSAEVVVKIARAYKAPVLEGLVRCGIITEEEANLRHTLELVEALQRASDQQLLEELLRRVDEEGKLVHPALDKPLENLPEAPANVIQIAALSDKEIAEGVYQEPEGIAALSQYNPNLEYDQ